MSAELPQQAAGHRIARQEHGMAAQQVSQHRTSCSLQQQLGKAKAKYSRQNVNGQKQWHRLPLEDRGRNKFWFSSLFRLNPLFFSSGAVFSFLKACDT